MAGPWEKYQQVEVPADGPWAKYGQKPAPTKVAERSTGEKIKRDLGLSTRNVVEGAGDLVGLFTDPLIHGWNAVTGDNQMTTRQAWGSLLDRVGTPRPETASERVQADAGRALTGVGLTMGLGSVATNLPRLQQFLTAAPKTQVAGAATGAAAAGGAREAGLPVPVQVGAGIVGGLTPAAGSSLASLATGAGRQVVRSTVSPFTGKGVDQAVGTVLRGSALHPERLGIPGPSAVPGVSRTLAEETLDPGIAQLQRTVAARRGAEFDQMRRVNNAARSEALGGIAGDRAAMDEAVRARSTAANPLRRDAMRGDKVDTTRIVSQLERLANTQKGRSAVQDGLRKVGELLRSDKPIPVSEADNVRGTIGDMLDGKFGGDNAAALKGSRLLMMAKNQLDRTLAKQAPAYGQYIEAYKQGSKPINRMQLGETLLDSGTGPTIDGTTGAYQILPGQFGRQVKDLDRAAVRATGFNKAKASDILGEQDFATIGAINDDLSRQVFADTAARGAGSDSFQKFMTRGDILGAVQELGFSVPGSGLLRMLGKAGTDRVNARLAEALANPAEARRILEQATPTERRVIEEALMRLQAAPGAVVPAYSSSKD